MYFSGVSCCGIREMGGLSEHEGHMEGFMREMGKHTIDPGTTTGSRWRYCIFSQANKGRKYGIELAAYIKEHNLGDVVETGWNVNPNSGNDLKVWMWTVDWDAFRAHYQKVKYPNEVLGIVDKTAKVATPPVSTEPQAIPRRPDPVIDPAYFRRVEQILSAENPFWTNLTSSGGGGGNSFGAYANDANTTSGEV